jgi:hypothetical protein
MKWDVGKLLECNTSFMKNFIVVVGMNSFYQYNIAERLQCAA